jgi:hypothetical protein
MAQGNPRTMEFWDGTFAYNKLVVKEHQFQGNIITLELSGSTLELGPQIENGPKAWGTEDRIIVTVRKSECQFDFEVKKIECDVNRVSGRITWTVNNRLSKTLDTVFTNLRVKASSKTDFFGSVKMDLTIPADEYFTPANEDISVDFASLDFSF